MWSKHRTQNKLISITKYCRYQIMNFKKYFPFENFVLSTKLSTLEVLHRIKDNIEPERGFSLTFSKREYSKLYTGQIHGLTFTMNRNINYKNSFLPIITGQIVTFPYQTEIRVKMQPYNIVLVFMTIWFGGVGLVCVGEVITGLLKFKQI